MDSLSGNRPWLSSYPRWVPHDLDAGPNTAIGDFLTTAASQPDEIALCYFDTPITYRQLNLSSDSLAAAFHSMGLRKGDRIIADLQNIPQFLVAVYAAWKIGAIVVPVNPMYKEKELSYFAKDSGAKLFVTLDEIAAQLDLSFVKDTHIQNVVTTSALDFLDGNDPIPGILTQCKRHSVPGCRDLIALLGEFKGKRVDLPDCEPESVAYLTYTSGTTGWPKGAMNTHGNIAFSARVYQSMMRIDDNDVVLGVAPLFHVTGEVAHAAIAALAGIPLVLSCRFDAAETLRLMERWRVSMTVAAITVYIAWMNHPDMKKRDLSNFLKAYSGGAPVSGALVDQFMDLTGSYLHNVYGMTETNSPSHIVPLGKRAPIDAESGALSVGVPVPSSLSKICDLEDREKDLLPGEVGEIANRGPMVIPGYWQRPEDTKSAIENGWLYTGDVGKMDSAGWFYVVDRKKDLINVSGFKVWPRDVEDVIYQHPSVKEAAVIGVPDEYRGETVKAYVALKNGLEGSIKEQELIDFCKSRMAAYKYPRLVEFVPEIPKT